jgi:hypothetical protein
MKKIWVVVLVCLAGAWGFGLDLTSYPTDVIEKGNFIINGGLGLGNSSPGNTQVVPPIVLDVEYAFPVFDLPFSFGLLIGVGSTEQRYSNGGEKYAYSWVDFALGVRIAYHFNWNISRLDTYAAMTLGVNSIYGATSGGTASIQPEVEDVISTFLFGLHLGVRYFVSEHIGAFVEMGYSPFSVFSAGLALKF